MAHLVSGIKRCGCLLVLSKTFGMRKANFSRTREFCSGSWFGGSVGNKTQGELGLQF